MATFDSEAAPVGLGVGAPSGDRCNPSKAKKGKFMITHRTDEVEIPTGAASVDDWQPFDDDEMYRVVLSPCMLVPGRSEVTVQSSAIQFSDGGICTSDDVIEEPKVYVTNDNDTGLAPEQARELAWHLTQAAEIAEQWTGGSRAVSRLSTAKRAVLQAYTESRKLPGNAGDYLQAALDSIADAEAAMR